MARNIEPESHIAFELSDHLPYLFKHIHAQLEVASAGKLAKFGINVAVWRILAVLWEHDNLSHRELAHLTSIEVSTLSRVSKTVQRNGLIRRKRTQEDQRTVRITLTDKGRDLAQSIIPWVVKVQDELFANIPAQDIRTLTRILNDVSNNLNRFTEADPDITCGLEEQETSERPPPAAGIASSRTTSPKTGTGTPKEKKFPAIKAARARKVASPTKSSPTKI